MLQTANLGKSLGFLFLIRCILLLFDLIEYFLDILNVRSGMAPRGDVNDNLQIIYPFAFLHLADLVQFDFLRFFPVSDYVETEV